MEYDQISYALAKQIDRAHTISTDYGDLLLDDEMARAVAAALEPILRQRLQKIDSK